MRRALGVAALLLATRVEAWACSGPGALDAILGAELLGWSLFGTSLVLLIAGAAFARRLRRRWRSLWPVPLVAVIHPGWWMSARSGDCGAMLSLGALAFTLIALITAVLLVVLARRAARATRVPAPETSRVV